ncbi:MAG TPA: glycosyltransferase family 4 protein [Candidatus Saccharimonadales bacterium]|nr:glycosyltransferase family 4 protein [Candidatus Saccharimonadales bacterium]
MKIGLVLDDTLDTPDGVQQYVLNVGTWLSTQGHDVHYLVGATTRTDIPNIHSLGRNVKVRFNGNKMSIPLPAARRRLRAFLEAEQFDVLHVQVPYSPMLGGRLVAAAPATTAVVGTFHILPYSRLVTFANHLLAVLNRTTGKRFDQMLAVSAPAQDFARAVYGYEADVVPNPVNLAQFNGITSDSTTTNIVFLGRLVERKGVQYLLQAVASLRARQLYDGELRVHIGGKGDLRPRLEQFVHANGLDDMVQFYGFIDEAHKAHFLSQGDLVVYPSVSGESFGIVLLEAMASARGVVLAGDNPGYASVMQLYPLQLFDPRDPGLLAEKIAWYLDRPVERDAAAKLQHEYVQHFDINVVGSRLLTIYKRVLQTRRSM